MRLLKDIIKNLIRYIMLLEFVFVPPVIYFKDRFDTTPSPLVRVCLMIYMITMIFIFHWVIGSDK